MDKQMDEIMLKEIMKWCSSVGLNNGGSNSNSNSNGNRGAAVLYLSTARSIPSPSSPPILNDIFAILKLSAEVCSLSLLKLAKHVS